MGKAVCGRFKVDLSGFGSAGGLVEVDWGASGILSSWCVVGPELKRPQGGGCGFVPVCGQIARSAGQTSIVSGTGNGLPGAMNLAGKGRLPGGEMRQTKIAEVEQAKLL
jgi:hypothetical protein